MNCNFQDEKHALRLFKEKEQRFASTVINEEAINTVLFSVDSFHESHQKDE